MKKQIGGLLIAGGLFGILYFGYQYLQKTNSIELFGADIAVTTGEIAPIIISALVLAGGVFISKR